MAVRVLSIDGGGIRGIIPARLLAEFERHAQRPAHELFDLIAGTSTGAIIALAVTTPRPDRPAECWSAAELVELYARQGPAIFERSPLRTLATLGGLIGPKYAARSLERVLHDYFGHARLSDLRADVLITSYDIQGTAPTAGQAAGPQPLFFKSREARHDRSLDHAVADVARATSAAPTYFPPDRLAGHTLVDGGVFANNPALCAYAEAVRRRDDDEVVVVSLGTGRLTDPITYRRARGWGLVRWAQPLHILMDGASVAIDYQLDQLLGADMRHFRFQTRLDGVADRLDDASARNIAALEELASEYASSQQERIERALAALGGDRRRR